MNKHNNNSLSNKHQKAHHEHNSWIEDLDGWQSNLFQIRATLHRFQAVLCEHKSRLVKHRRAIASHEKSMREQELKFTLAHVSDSAKSDFNKNESSEMQQSLHEEIRREHEQLNATQKDLQGAISFLSKQL